MKNLFLIIILFVSTHVFSFNKQVKVNTVKEFFEALDDNTEIIVQSEVLDFTVENLEEILGIAESEDYWLSEKPLLVRNPKSYYITDGIVLYGYENLTIRSESHTEIISGNESDNILSFKNCKGILLEGFSIYHTVDVCSGAVLSILLSENVQVSDCSLNGSGAYGAYLIGATNVQFTNVAIYNNQFNAVYAINSNAIKFNECDIYDNHQWSMSLIHSDISDLSFTECNIHDNQSKRLIFSPQELFFNTAFMNCQVADNVFDFNPEDFTETDKKSNKEKQEMILKLFMHFLENQLRTDGDSRNNEFQSFFTSDPLISYKNNTNFKNILSFYFNLKRNYFEIEDYHILGNKITINKNSKQAALWEFSFDQKNKIKKVTYHQVN